ncbi:hypothetical protein AQUCO_00500182v1 [Aquilegia coerulea]|uniref:Bulb-type lectin domain-containing protein n=1 Tax=Aquilegia coerulea TaxID=218851 RepID=A0A2G5EQR5_AQUCA|nr:hypothetical protein AQUCO_00500182v1 [Aquilegia coerulea]
MVFFFTPGLCKSYIPIGFQVRIPVPSMYNNSFLGRAFFIETSYEVPNFKVGLSVEAVNGDHSCSLGVFLGDYRVWNSAHFMQFYARGICMLELTKYGNLQLRDSKGGIGWRSGTSLQGVERLQLLRSGNLVLTDAMDLIKWQSYNFPTDGMLWGQRLSVSTFLTSFSNSSSIFYSFEIQNNKLALYLNSDKQKYSYWEFRLTKNRSIAFAEFGSTGLKLFDGKVRKLAQILPKRLEPLRFLALEKNTGNLKFYHYSALKGKFEASFEAINSTCDLPMACGPYGICTFSNNCTCIQFSRKMYRHDPNCSEDFSSKFCQSTSPVEMVEIMGVKSILRVPPQRVNVSKEECLNLCVHDCKCAAVLYSVTGTAIFLQECYHYGVVRGLKQVEQGIGLSYLVKVPKGVGGDSGKSWNAKTWLLITGGVIDGLVILLVMGGFAYYMFVIRRRNSL